jgi:hypothetical protein
MDTLSEYFGAGTLDRPIDLLDHKSITWYDTDLPVVRLWEIVNRWIERRGVVRSLPC